MRLPLRLLLALNGVDAGLTIAATLLGSAREVNPLMAACLSVSPFFFLAIKLALIDVGILILSWGRRHWAARLALSVSLGGYAALVVWTIRVLQLYSTALHLVK